MGIPESILKKLIVPGSFKRESDHFTVQINNSFAPASVSRFEIRIDDIPVAADHVLLSSAHLGDTSSKTIQPESPVILAVNDVITIRVDEKVTGDNIRIFATTREVGDIEFSITSHFKKKKFKKLRTGLLDFLKKPKYASFKIDLDHSMGKASPLIYGHFIEHLERCIYDGIWSSNGDTLRLDTLKLIEQLQPSIIRYPGGNFASGYHWEDGIGPKQNRPARHDAAWQAEESNQVGTDEFLEFCELVHTEPYLVVNDGSGTPEEAARWVEYCNGNLDTIQGKRRAANGHEAPYNVKFWGVGNEVWGPWQIGTTSAENYVKRLRKFILAMRAVDPEIKIIAVGHNPLTDDPDDPAARWNRIVLENAGDLIDYLSWHIYQPEKESWKTEYDPAELMKNVNAAHMDLEEILLRVENQIKEHSGRKILQAVDEWNLWLPPLEYNVSMHSVTYTMRDALYCTSALATFARHNHTVGMANLAQMVNVLPLIQTNETSAIRTAMYYPFLFFSDLPDEIVASTGNSETFSCSFMDPNMKARSSVPYLDGISAIDQEQKEIGLILVNRYPLDKLQIKITFMQNGWYQPIESRLLHASHPGASNSFTHPDEIKITTHTLPKQTANGWEVTMPACSVAYLKFKIA
jgi:alpha-N-arabinofuranosidase